MHYDSKKIQIKHLEKEDVSIFQKLIRLFQEVFEYSKPVIIEDLYLKTLLSKPDFIVYAAFHGNEIVGGLTAYVLPSYYAATSEIFIYDIAVKAAHQRTGIGKRLLKSLQEYCKEKGIQEIFVAANKEDLHALDFYRSTGGKAEKVVHFTYFF